LSDSEFTKKDGYVLIFYIELPAATGSLGCPFRQFLFQLFYRNTS